MASPATDIYFRAPAVPPFPLGSAFTLVCYGDDGLGDDGNLQSDYSWQFWLNSGSGDVLVQNFGVSNYYNFSDLVIGSYIFTAKVSTNGGSTIDRTETYQFSIVSGAYPVGGEKRYTCNGAVDIKDTPAAILKSILSSMDATAIYTGGAWHILGGMPAEPSGDVIDESWLNGPVTFGTGNNKNNLHNTGTGTFVNPDDHWAASAFPTVQIHAYVDDDREELAVDLTLNWTTSGFTAQRLARLAVERSRRGLTVTLPCNYKALGIAVDDVKLVTIAELGWTEMRCRVIDWSFSPMGGVNLTLGLDDSDLMNITSGDLKPIPIPPLTTLPDPWDVESPSNLQFVEYLYAGNVASIIKTRLDISWQYPLSGVLRYEVDRLTPGASEWSRVGETATETISDYDAVTGLNYYRVRAINSLGVDSEWVTDAVTIIGKTAPPANVASATATVGLQGVSLAWPPVADVDLEAYLVRLGATWSGGVQVAKTPDTTALLGFLPVGTTTIKVKALDTSKNESKVEATTTATVQAPAAPAPGATIKGTDCTISWDDCTTSYGLDRYEIRYGTSFDAGVEVSTVKGTSLKLPVTWTGSRTYWVRAVDSAGNAGTAGSAVVTIVAASAPPVSATLGGTLCKLTWSVPAATLPIDRYEIRIGSSWAAATSLGTVKGTVYSLPATWPSAQLWVAAIDVNNTTGAPGSVSVTVNMPVVSGLAADVIDNNVLLRWTGSPGSLQIDHYEVRRGATWAAASVVGSATGTFGLLFEAASGTYTYWVAGYDAAGNQGAPVSVATAVSQPPDYILNVDWPSDFSGTKTNLFNDPISGWLAMVQTGETWATHFTNNSKTTIQQFIDAGFTNYLQPSAPSAQYVETFDYGTLLAGTKITVALNHTALLGAPVVQCTIETSPDATTWTSFTNMWQAYGTAFRYVRITLNWSATGQAIDQVLGLNVRLDSKIRNDAGSGTVTVANDGAACMFSVDFVDVTSITVTPSGNTAKYAIYDFVDVPNPTGFTVYLYDSAGNRTTGGFSWSARGY